MRWVKSFAGPDAEAGSAWRLESGGFTVGLVTTAGPGRWEWRTGGLGFPVARGVEPTAEDAKAAAGRVVRGEGRP